MKTYVREAIQELEALGFECAEDPFGRTGKRCYRHPYQPDTVLRLWDGASQAQCIAIRRQANVIAGSGSTGPKLPTSIRERATAHRSKKMAAKAREDAARAARAAKAERDYSVRHELAETDRHRHEIEDLMQPGHGH